MKNGKLARSIRSLPRSKLQDSATSSLQTVHPALGLISGCVNFILETYIAPPLETTAQRRNPLICYNSIDIVKRILVFLYALLRLWNRLPPAFNMTSI